MIAYICIRISDKHFPSEVLKTVTHEPINPVTTVQRALLQHTHVHMHAHTKRELIYFQFFNNCSPIILISCTVVNTETRNWTKCIVSGGGVCSHTWDTCIPPPPKAQGSQRKRARKMVKVRGREGPERDGVLWT